jgi:hypothetical protein
MSNIGINIEAMMTPTMQPNIKRNTGSITVVSFFMA